MRKVAAVIFCLFYFSCSFADEIAALDFHTESYLGLKEFLKNSTVSRWDEAALGESDGKSVYIFEFTKEEPLQRGTLSFSGTYTLSFYNNGDGQTGMDYTADLNCVREGKTAVAHKILTQCTVNHLGTVLEGFSRSFYREKETSYGVTGIANLEGYVIRIPVPENYNPVK